MRKAKIERSADVVEFKRICTELFQASTSGHTFDQIVIMVLKTKYGNFARANDIVLEDIAFIYDITRERVRQIEDAIVKKLKHPLLSDYWKVVREAISATGVELLTPEDIIKKNKRKETHKSLLKEANAKAIAEKKERNKKRNVNRDNENPMNLKGRHAA